jgi:hypothetical protein
MSNKKIRKYLGCHFGSSGAEPAILAVLLFLIQTPHIPHHSNMAHLDDSNYNYHNDPH